MRKEVSETKFGYTYLVPLDFSLGIILKVSVSFETTFDDFAELLSESFVVEKMVDSKTGTRSLGRISGTNTFLGGTNAKNGRPSLI